jgi:hypothetical protein
MGFSMTVEQPVHELENIEFCQCHPVFDGFKYRMVRNFPLSLDKDTTIIPQIQTHRNARRWACAVGKAGLSLTGGLPINQELYVKYISWGDKFKEWQNLEEGGLTRLSKGMSEQYKTPTTSARVSFWKAFGYAPGHQELIEGLIRELDLVAETRQRLRRENYRGAFIPVLGLRLGRDIEIPMHDL